MELIICLILNFVLVRVIGFLHCKITFFSPFLFLCFLVFSTSKPRFLIAEKRCKRREPHSLWSWDVFLNVRVLIKVKEQPIIPGLKCHREIAAENLQALEWFISGFCPSFIASAISIFSLNLCVHCTNRLEITSSWNTSSSGLFKIACVCVHADVA